MTARSPLGPRYWLLLTVLAWLAFAVCGVPAVHAEGDVTLRQEYLRVTYYTLPGRMADGSLVHDGAAACSQWMPFGTVLEFSDGRQVTCQDRGHGDWFWRGWVDVWTPDATSGLIGVERAYGAYSWVTVVRWGE